jgi:hypothetical protein
VQACAVAACSRRVQGRVLVRKVLDLRTRKLGQRSKWSWGTNNNNGMGPRKSSAATVVQQLVMCQHNSCIYFLHKLCIIFLHKLCIIFLPNRTLSARDRSGLGCSHPRNHAVPARDASEKFGTVLSNCIRLCWRCLMLMGPLSTKIHGASQCV